MEDNYTKTSKLDRISIICQGSRGDIQPYVAIGVSIPDQTHDVQKLTLLHIIGTYHFIDSY